jgi:regulator of nucleoside diphosphate kinase
MPSTETFQLTTKDHTVLDVMRERSTGRDEIVAEILRRKLSRAVVLFGEDIPAEVVTLSSRVTYRVDGGPAETRIISPENMRGLVGLLLPIGHPRALALIGLAEGQSMTIPKPGGGTETLAVVQVVYQPEAARRERLEPAPKAAPRPPRHNSGFLRLVHDADAGAGMPVESQPVFVDTGPDDPGPSAA